MDKLQKISDNIFIEVVKKGTLFTSHWGSFKRNAMYDIISERWYLKHTPYKKILKQFMPEGFFDKEQKSDYSIHTHKIIVYEFVN